MRSRVKNPTDQHTAATHVREVMNRGRLRDAWRLTEQYQKFLTDLEPRALFIFGAAFATSTRTVCQERFQELWLQAVKHEDYSRTFHADIVCWLSTVLSKSGQTDKAEALLFNHLHLLYQEHPAGLRIAIEALSRAPGGAVYAQRLQFRLA